MTSSSSTFLRHCRQQAGRASRTWTRNYSRAHQRRLPSAKAAGLQAIRIDDWLASQQRSEPSSNSNNNITSPTFQGFPFNLTEWLVKAPKGFENFFPKDNDDGSREPQGEPDKDSKNDKETSKGADTFKSNDKEQKKKRGNNRGGIPPPPNGEDPQTIAALLAMLLLVVTARSLLGDDESTSRNGREITFIDFRNYLLETGQVEKIVVVNNNMARIILRPGSEGVPAHLTLNHKNNRNNNNSNIRMNSTSEFVPSSNDPRSNRNMEDAESTVMEFAKPSADATASSPGVMGRSENRGRSMTPIYHFYIGSVESFEEQLSKSQSHIPSMEWVPVQYVNEINLLTEFLKATPMLAMLGVMFYLSRGMMGGTGAAGGSGGRGGMGGIFNVGKSNAKKINPENVDVNFSSVAGCDQAKMEIMEFVDFLKDSSRFEKLGAKIPKGAILQGPPGTGKTLLAKAVAGEAGVPFFSISGSDFVEMFVGVGPSRVRDLFKEARASAPCIVFIDEIDAVGRQRGRGGFGGNDERENTLNQLLVEMDGFTPSTGVVVLAGTNRVDILDQALTRPGRFDRQITIDKPDLQGRKEIFHVHLEGITLEGDKDDYAGRLAGLTPGFAGADIANLCNEAAIQAARRKGESVTMVDFEKATDRIIGGLESNKIMSTHEREIVAYHEAGHAVAGWFLEHADPLMKVTIIPRTSGALGFAQYLPKEVFLRTQDQIMDIVCMALAGRAAEQVFFGRVTTGASDDLRRVTQMVYSTIQTYGMNPVVGQLAYPQDDDGMPGSKPYSDATAEAMDTEARAIVEAAYNRTVELITERKDQVEKVAKLLLDQETITHDDMIDTIGERPFEGDSQYKEYVSARHGRSKKEPETEEEPAPTSDETHDDTSEGFGGTNGGLTPGLASRSF